MKNSEPRRGLRVSSVHPGCIRPPLVEDFGQRPGFDADAFRQEPGSRHPVSHVGEPDDIARGVVYPVSDESKFMTDRIGTGDRRRVHLRQARIGNQWITGGALPAGVVAGSTPLMRLVFRMNRAIGNT